MHTKNTRFLLIFWMILALSAGSPMPAAQAQAAEFLDGPELTIRADPAYKNFRIPAPAAARSPRPNAVNGFTVTFIPAGGANPGTASTCDAYPAEAQAAFLYAVNIWASYIHPAETIKISACWRLLGTGILGSAGPALYGWGAGAPSPLMNGVWYPLGLIQALSHTDPSGGGYAIRSRFTSDIGAAYGTWYFGTDGNPGFNQYDFTSVVLHEIGHGLGFSGSMTVSGGLGSYGLGGSGYPMIYDEFTQDQFGTPLLSYTNNSADLAGALTSGAYFNGADADAANGGNPVQLYAPASWQQGSSYSHLGESFNGTPNALMTYSINNGESNHDPGPVALGVLSDIGWPVNLPAPTAPAAPSGLGASAISNSQINLTWTDGSNNETGFQVEHSTDGSAWTPVGTTAANVVAYADGGLAQGTKYFYRVRAINAIGNSDYTSSASAVTTGAPPAPGSLGAAAYGATAVRLTWLDQSNIESGYKIERSDNLGGSWGTITTTPANASSYLDTGRTAGHTYQYRVTTLSANGPSSAASASATTWSQSYSIYTPIAAR